MDRSLGIKYERENSLISGSSGMEGRRIRNRIVCGHVVIFESSYIMAPHNAHEHNGRELEKGASNIYVSVSTCEHRVNCRSKRLGLAKNHSMTGTTESCSHVILP